MGSSKPLILSFQMFCLTPERATQTNEQLQRGDTQLLRETSLDNRAGERRLFLPGASCSQAIPNHGHINHN